MIEQTSTVVIIAFILGLDAFSVSIGMGLTGVKRDFEFKFAGTVGVFHIFMPLIGLYLGLAVGKILGIWASRAGALVLAYIALDFLIKGYKESKTKHFSFKDAQSILKKDGEINRGGWKTALVLGLSVSIDALTVGFSLGTLNMPILFTVIVMGAVAGTMTLLGFWGGRIFSRLVGSYAQIIGGITLLGLAVKLFF
ncbi:MAG: manganese efflux pump MntP family protein [Syntrophomonadaceae bacterium]|jgi:putative Mn2+ efflux pump MntP